MKGFLIEKKGINKYGKKCDLLFKLIIPLINNERKGKGLGGKKIRDEEKGKKRDDS